jgi:hypothetical protein
MQCDGKEHDMKHVILLCSCRKSKEQNFCLGLESENVCVCVRMRVMYGYVGAGIV